MTDRDTITLPREVVKQVLDALEWSWGGNQLERRHAIRTLRTALDAPPQEHPGYVIGSHWLETAYSRVCAGEAEADVLRDMGWERVDEALRRDAERLQERCDELGSDKDRWYRMAELHCTTIDRLKDAMRKAMAMLDKHDPEPAGAFAVLLLALNPELQSAKNAALRREDV